MFVPENLRDEAHPMGDLMLKTLHYLQHFWDQLFAYLKDDLYCIDNNIAERPIRPMTVERKRSCYAGLLLMGCKNPLMLGRHKSVETSAIFHAFIKTCKINQRVLSRSGESNGISTIEYYKKLFSDLLTGNDNFASLLPQTIGIKR